MPLMLRFFFNRLSPVVLLVEILGVIGLIGFLGSKTWWVEWRTFARIGFGLFIILWLAVRFFGTVKWYPRESGLTQARYLGIETHFSKMLVPNAYIIFITALWLWLGGWPVFMWIANMPLLLFVTVNTILLSFHYQDKDTTPANYYTGDRGDPAAKSVARQTAQA